MELGKSNKATVDLGGGSRYSWVEELVHSTGQIGPLLLLWCFGHCLFQSHHLDLCS